MSSVEDLVQIPPATSPLLLPTRGRSSASGSIAAGAAAPNATTGSSRQAGSRHGAAHRHSSVDSIMLEQDIPEDLELEFMAPGDYTDRYRSGSYDDDDGETRSGRSDSEDGAEFDEDENELDDEQDIEDFSLEDGHIAGVASCNMRLSAKHYQSPEFSASLLELLRDDLQVPGWVELPIDLPPSAIHIHKVSGSLTNAVFFVSVPETVFELHLDQPDSFASDGHTTPPLSYGNSESAASTPLNRATVLSELEKGRSTPKPGQGGLNTNGALTSRAIPPASKSNSKGPVESVAISAPTLLLRIYGPSSGSLISRRTELHILHTLSSSYQIGPRVLGTFSNGRVEEYFHSRALHKEEMRDERISRWIGRRMRELHSVRLDEMVPSGGPERSPSSGSKPQRPPLEHAGAHKSSSASIYSVSSSSSIFSFGASYYSDSSSNAGSYAGSMEGSQFGTPVVSSPHLLPRQASESRSGNKRRSRAGSIASGSSLRSRRSTKDRLGVWENITRWTREAKVVLQALDELASMPGFDSFFDPPPPSPIIRAVDLGDSTATPTVTPPNDGTGASSSSGQHVPPLSSPMHTIALRAALNLPLFEQQVKMYRRYVHQWEKREGKSKRVFAHNDTQYGNLLLLTPTDEERQNGEDDVAAFDRSLAAPHQKIIVVDFEYASANPRAFDIANHFIEWQADYHHPSMSHALSTNKYPNRAERQRFLRAYVGCDQGRDVSRQSSSSSLYSDGAASPQREDVRVLRLEDEVRVWEASSHAMWAVWGIVQGKEDLLVMVEKWKKVCKIRQERKTRGEVGLAKGLEKVNLEEQQSADCKDEGATRPVLRRGKSGEIVNPEDTAEQEVEEDDTEMIAVDFDYLSYAFGRMDLFRNQLKALGIVD
ncbi:BZ3500_MvSof-1268-A1-R1_Chr5-2g07865 [Microbotryum saponariae]|uniref:BZ3500_MvSof-1268-A1-R1_Chr5-2g07865 protein n=1 Tax=Microbotryum saponariae TaxID=289078 RepID=A0A2X0LFF2_9BASI|nr:BZ3500_MvSof-1268-A1-R1_Chr5-2g07865 [Microbotryum saponariae]SDA05734.1 BZ3501_MvSof-1269-A2-R1_Chr5-2g07687 [Microbotryum saponariae]